MSFWILNRPFPPFYMQDNQANPKNNVMGWSVKIHHKITQNVELDFKRFFY